MLNDILVHIPVYSEPRPAVDAGTSVASLFKSHADAVAFAYQPLLESSIALEGGRAALAIQDDVGAAQATAALSQFETAARQLNVTHAVRAISTKPDMVSRVFGHLARLYDLSVVVQPNGAKTNHDRPIFEAALFYSGRPVLIVPYIHTGPLNLDVAMVCWDGSRPAARAVRDAMPFLHKTRQIKIATVNEPIEPGETSAAALAQHLARHNLKADVLQLSADPGNIHNSILSAASDEGAGLLVMGGYGHSRLREALLGGVSRGIFESLTVPALVAN